MTRPADFFGAALCDLESNELTAAINIVRTMTADIDPDDPGVHRNLVMLWRAIADAIACEIAQRPLHRLMSDSDLDALDGLGMTED